VQRLDIWLPIASPKNINLNSLRLKDIVLAEVVAIKIPDAIKARIKIKIEHNLEEGKLDP
jgi:hypothetical protein